MSTKNGGREQSSHLGDTDHLLSSDDVLSQYYQKKCLIPLRESSLLNSCFLVLLCFLSLFGPFSSLSSWRMGTVEPLAGDSFSLILLRCPLPFVSSSLGLRPSHAPPPSLPPSLFSPYSSLPSPSPVYIFSPLPSFASSDFRGETFCYGEN